MRPDLDEYEELNDTTTPRSRAMSWVVLSVAVGGFAALAYYAYHSGAQSTQEGDLMVVQADDSPIKQVPVDPEGEQFPNKDKTIYDVIAPATGDRQVEKLLPDPEHPVMAGDVEDTADMDAVAPPVAAPSVTASAAPATIAREASATTTFVNKNPQIAAVATPMDPVDTQSLKQPAPVTAPVPTAAPLAAKPAVTAVGEPTFINEKPSVAVKKSPEPAVVPAPKPSEAMAVKEAPVAELPKPEKLAALAAGGVYKVQLGAFKSEEEALGQWKKIRAKFAGVVGGEPTIIKADLPNGTFYRLRASGYASADAAKAACAKLSAKGQACFPAGK